MKKFNKIAISLVPLILVSCGGGGGGGGGGAPSLPRVEPPVVQPNQGQNLPQNQQPSVPAQPINQPNQPTEPSVPNQPAPNLPQIPEYNPDDFPLSNKISNPSENLFEPRANRHDTENVTKYSFDPRSQNIQRDRVEVGIVDSNFFDLDVYRGKIKVFGANTLNDSLQNSHGSMVATIIAKNLSSDSKIYAHSSAQGGSNGLSILVSDDFYDTLHQKGVRVFNNSFGNPPPLSSDIDVRLPYHTHSNMIEFAQNDSIMVWATGNDRNLHSPSPQALYPKYNQKAKNGWIAVGAVDNDSDILPARYSNRFGDAQNWGITTKGSYRYSDELLVTDNNGNSEYFHLNGTSFAAPKVSAAVTDVWNKFPWMSNHLVVVSVLSTANKPGTNEPTKGTSNNFGWGILNKERAMNGPALFDKRLLTNKDDIQNSFRDRLVVKFDDIDNENIEKFTWSNNISGDAGIYKDGLGTLYLTGENDYKGATTIKNGTLVFTNSLKNASVDIQDNGTFLARNPDKKVRVEGYYSQYFGTISEFSNKGSLNVYGKGLEIVGDYKGSENSRIVIDIDRSNLRIDGDMDMGGSRIVADIEKLDSIPKRYENKREIISANSIENYNGDYKISQKISPFVEVKEIKQNGNSISASYARNSSEVVLANLQALTPSRLSAANNFETALDELSQNPTNTTSAVALSFLNAAASNLPTIYDELSANIHSQSMQILAKQNQITSSKLANQASNFKGNGFFTQGIYGTTRVSSNGFANTKAKTTGGIFGGKTTKDDLNFGFALTQAKTNADFSDNAGKNKLDSTGGFVFASKDFDDFYLSTILGINKNSNKIDRSLQNQTLSTRYSSYLYSLYSEAGLKFSQSNFEFSPFVLANLTHIRRGGFDESKPFSVRSSKAKFNNHYLGAGFRAGLNLESFRLNFGLSHSFLLNPSDFGFNANYNGINQGIHIKGAKQGRNLTSLNSTLGYQLTPNFGLSLNYEKTLQNSKNESQVFNLGAFYQF